MSQDKKSKEDDIKKLRKILDNPDDPNVKKSYTKNNENLESIRKRLSGDSKNNSVNELLRQSSSLEPTVNIHEDKFEQEEKSEEDIEEFEEVGEITEEPDIARENKIDSDYDLFSDQELYEIEKIEVPEIKFSEVNKEEIEDTSQEVTFIEEKNETLAEDKNVEQKVPEWEPLEKETEISEEKNETNVTFQTEEIEVKPKKEEEIPNWEAVSEEEVKAEVQTFTTETDIKKETLEPKPVNKVDIKKKQKDIKKQKQEEKKRKKAELKKQKQEEKQKKKQENSKKKQQKKKPKTKKDINSRKTLSTEEQETEWVSYTDEKDVDLSEDKSYKYGEYRLFKKEITTGNGKNRTVHFFSKTKPDEGEPTPLPDGYEVHVNKKTGLPYLKKK